MNNQKILISIVCVVVLAAVGFSIYKSRNNVSPKQALISNFEDCAKAGYPVMESYPRQCRIPGGELFVENVVSPNPNSEPINKTSPGYVSGHVTIGPNCPVEREDQPCKTPPEAYTSREAVVYASDNSTVLKKVRLDTQGNYKITLAAGNYFIQIIPGGIRPSDKKPITIKSGETSVLDFDVDTGIR